ncbi:MAG: methyl-accepting chemotaxis protein [Rhodocyclaceae bacterium]|nr:methyl-accepting chemotaxis protein [Rhodocyclaceae bacterium]
MLFAPAVSLMQRLKYPAKFALIGLAAFVTVAYLVTVLSISLSKSIGQSRAELEGVEVIKPVLRLVQLVQQHRDMVSGVLAGNADMRDSVKKKTAEIDEAIRRTDSMLAGMKVVARQQEAWKILRIEWETLAVEWPDMTRPSSFIAHRSVIQTAMQIISGIGEDSSLIMDPDLDSYYLANTALFVMPDTLERLSIIRGAGNAMLTGKSITDYEKHEFSTWLGVLNKMNEDLNTSLSRAEKANPEMKNILAQIGGRYLSEAADVAMIVQGEMLTGRLSTPAGDFYGKASGVIDAAFDELDRTLLPTLSRLIEARIVKLDAQLYLSLGLAVLIVLLVVYLTAGMYLSIVGSVACLAQGAQKIAEGDLTVRVSLGTQDEMAHIGKSFNSMAEALNGLIGKVQASAADVSAAATSVAASSEQIQGGSQRQSEAASSMAASVEQTTVGIDQIAEHARNAHAVSDESGKLSEAGCEVVGRSVTEMKRIAESVEQSAQLIEELGRQSDRISAIVNVIKDIADQTNLLALNAAIEAARAGESGRGFAVVADEVRKLAERTTQSTQDIASMIAAIQNGTAQAVNSMHAGVERVAGGVEMAMQAGEAMERIHAGALHVVRSISDISLALKEQSAASAEIAVNVEKIAQMAEENNAAVAGTTGTARELERLAEGLQAEIRRYKVR